MLISIGNTFDSINQAAKSNINSLSGNDTGSQSTTTTTTTTTTSDPGNSNSTSTTMKTNSQY